MKKNYTLVLASANKHKIEEFKEILDCKVLSLEDIGFSEDIVEDGNSFLENSLIKAKAVHKFLETKGLKYPVLADDTGLCVEALGGEPGIYSARYSGDHDFKKNRDKLKEKLKGVKNRRAYFTTVLVKMEPDGSYKSYEGRTYGKILEKERGDLTFGYNSLFLSDELGKTFGEATLEERARISHRGKAVELLKKDLK